MARTYVIGGRSEVRVYRERTFGRIHYYTYVPRVYYHPAFYGWAYRPWGTPVRYAWEFGPSPWYGYYGGYFVAEPVYPTASLWLTDFLLAENLRLAYENRVAANGGTPPDATAASGSAALSPEIKRQIAEEVQQQLAAERDMAAQSQTGATLTPSIDTLPLALDPKQKLFVVASGLDLTSGSQACSLTPGDIVERTSRNVSDDGKVPIAVLNSKDGDCPVDFAAAMDVSTLQDMHNQFREQIAAGMDKLASNQAKGLPSAPAAMPRVVADGQASADSEARALLSQQASEADKTEAEVKLPPAGRRTVITAQCDVCVTIATVALLRASVTVAAQTPSAPSTEEQILSEYPKGTVLRVRVSGMATTVGCKVAATSTFKDGKVSGPGFGQKLALGALQCTVNSLDVSTQVYLSEAHLIPKGDRLMMSIAVCNPSDCPNGTDGAQWAQVNLDFPKGVVATAGPNLFRAAARDDFREDRHRGSGGPARAVRSVAGPVGTAGAYHARFTLRQRRR